MTGDQLEQETLQWLAQVGYTVNHGLDIAPDGSTPLRRNYQQVLLQDNLRKALQRLNPHMPQAAHDEELAQGLDLGVPALLPSNRAFCKLLVNGVPQSISTTPGGTLAPGYINLNNAFPLTSFVANPALMLINRMKVEGFIVSEHMEVWPDALKELGTLVGTGKLRPRETIAQGIAAAPEAFLGLLKGKNFGKQLVKLV